MSQKRSRGAKQHRAKSPVQLAIVIPPSPTSSCTLGPISSPDSDIVFLDTEASAEAAEPTAQDAHDPQGGYMLLKEAQAKIEITAETIVSPDILAIAELQASMKTALQGLSKAFNHIEEQAERMNQLAVEIKAREQLETLRNELSQQIKRQGEELQSLKATLETKIKTAVAEHIRTTLPAMIKDSITHLIEEKVRQELSSQIPDQLRESGHGHQRQILEVKTNLHNSEARRYNASLAQSASLTVPLRPLLRPVPTPEQSPYPILASTSTTESVPNSALPLSTYPRPPAPTPIRRTMSTVPSAISRSQSLQQAVPQTPSVSELFPKDLRSLFALGPDDTRSLLREYGLRSVMSSPVMEEAKQKAFPTSNPPSHSTIPPAPPSPVEEESETEDDIESHVEDMNTFMSHIGVPFLMVPPPRPKETNADRRRKLAPLIINTSGLR